MILVKKEVCKESDLQCEGFSRQRDSNPAPLSIGKKVFIPKLKQYGEIFNNYDQVNWCGSGKTHMVLTPF